MILYFSGTGNSEYIAKQIGEQIEDKTLDLFTKIRQQDYSDILSDKTWIIVAPTYAWRIPRILEDWLLKTNLEGNKHIYFVMTCGGNIGNAGEYVEKLCVKKGMNYMGCIPVLMPENYIALFKTPNQQEALEIINHSTLKMNEICKGIKKLDKYSPATITFKDKLNSGLVNDLFYPMFVHAKKFQVTKECIRCGKCAEVCPMSNIKLVDGKPVWHKDCTHCMACICKCPKEAIEYGKHTLGLPRYTCPKNL